MGGCQLGGDPPGGRVVGQVDDAGVDGEVRVRGAGGVGHGGGDGGEPLGVPVEQDQVAAASGERVRERLADTAGRARDDRGAAGEDVALHHAAGCSIRGLATRRWKVMPSSSTGPRRIMRTSRR